MSTNFLVSLGVELVEEADRRGICLRLLGGIAVAVRCREVLRANTGLRRAYNDIDLAGYSRQTSEIDQLLVAKGFEPNKEFNFLRAGRRLMYFRRHDHTKVDVFLDEFRMCHVLPLIGRLELTPLTLSLTDLLLTKLQVVQTTERDVLDTYALMLDARKHVSGDNTVNFLDIGRIVGLCSRHWGWYTTLRKKLLVLTQYCPTTLDPSVALQVSELADHLATAILDGSKSLRWRLRSLLGEHWRWYDIPEEFEYE